jgi:hypothetical protein
LASQPGTSFTFKEDSLGWISPILLLPLIGSIQAVKSLEAIQVASFALLAFQNGFFWQVVLQRAVPSAPKE